MKGPFRVGGKVEPPYFIGRKEEMKALCLGVEESSQNYLVIGPRRVGKSSLLTNVRKKVDNVLMPEINCMEMISYSDFYRIIFEKTLDEYEKKHKTKDIATLFKKCLRDSILSAVKGIEEVGGSVEGIGRVYLRFREKEIDEKELVSKTFDFLEDFAIEKNQDIVLILDEFQKISDFDGFIFRALKSKMDSLKRVRFIFSGSSLSVLEKVFLMVDSPLYLMTTKIEVGPIGKEIVKEYIKKRLSAYNIWIEEDALDRIYDLTGGLPFYFQKLGDKCYQKAKIANLKKIRIKDVLESFEEMIDEFDSEFESRFEYKFSPKKKAILKTISKYDVCSVSEIAKTLGITVNKLGKDIKILQDSLTIKKIERGKYALIDNVFKHWLKNRM